VAERVAHFANRDDLNTAERSIWVTGQDVAAGATGVRSAWVED
jgi:hypothetical protein